VANATDPLLAVAAAPAASGEILPLDAAAPLRLDGQGGTWLVKDGQLDLFGVALDGGEPSGMRHPLGRIPAGGLLLGIPYRGSHGLIAVGRPGTVLLRLDWGDRRACSGESRAALVEAWVVRLAGSVCGEAPAWPEIVAEPGKRLELAIGARLHSPRSAVWIALQHGRLRIGDGPTVSAGSAAVLPIAAGLSVVAESDCSLDLIATADAIDAGAEAHGLGCFHAAILAELGRRIARAEEEARQRLDARAAADRRSALWTMRQLAGAAGAMPTPLEDAVIHDPTAAAFAAVAAAQGIVLRRRPQGSADPLDGLARANNIGLRRVLLRADWWRRDNGPLFAWRGTSRRPVALLPAGRRGYRLLDPADASAHAVKQTIADETAADAVMLYRPLPLRLRGVAGLIAFANRGLAREIATILGMGMLAGTVAALLPVATGFLFESAVPRAEIGQVLVVVTGLILAALGAGVFNLTRSIALVGLSGRIEAAVQPALMLRLLRLPVRFFRDFTTGELTNRVLAVQSMQWLLGGTTLSSLLSALFAVTSFGVILAYDPMLALVSAGLVAVAAVVIGGLAFAELRQERARIDLRGQEDGLVLQILQGIVKLRVAAAGARIFAVWAALFARQKRRFLVRERFVLLGEIFGEVYPLLAVLALLYAAARLLAAPAPTLTLGAFLAINAAFGQLLAATTALALALAASLDVVPLFERLRPILAGEPESHEDKGEVGLLTGRIELSRISFRYIAGARAVLDGLSLQIEPGEFVALVGPSGSGKSTLLRLLLGFEAAGSGDILYDGKSIGTLDTAALRRQIGVVLQQAHLASGSILDNITNGLPYTLAEAWAAARLAGIADEIEAMPMGMHTALLEGVTTLSGGQRQRLMIARALIGKPRILLFDEATSMLDNRSQLLVMQSIERLRTTRVVVAHRLSTVERADRIYVIERGRVVESGTFAALMAGDGLFRRLAQRQLL
jgi:NHLM bacteriocin system ABC transporter ATP-binding protein